MILILVKLSKISLNPSFVMMTEILPEYSLEEWVSYGYGLS